jgi:hypothetical protein
VRRNARAKRRWTVMGRAAVLVLVVSVMSSCAASPMEETKSMDLKTAKGIAMAMEDGATALVPAENTGERTQFETAHLLGCGDGEYSWSGHSTVSLVGDADAEAIIEAIAVLWEEEPGARVERKVARGGVLRVDLTRENDSYSAGVWQSGTILKINSFSPCFPLEDGQHPSDKY